MKIFCVVAWGGCLKGSRGQPLIHCYPVIRISFGGGVSRDVHERENKIAGVLRVCAERLGITESVGRMFPGASPAFLIDLLSRRQACRRCSWPSSPGLPVGFEVEHL